MHMAEALAMLQVGQHAIDQRKQALAPDPGPKLSVPRSLANELVDKLPLPRATLPESDGAAELTAMSGSECTTRSMAILRLHELFRVRGFSAGGRGRVRGSGPSR
jgi:hypothetical protein